MEVRIKMSLAARGQIPWNKGKKTGPLSDEHRKKIGAALTANESNPWWKGGITPKNAKIRNSRDYRIWREAVFRRDDWTCQDCGARSKKGKPIIIQAHHILSFATDPELRTTINNGKTLCIDCHKKTRSFLNK